MALFETDGVYAGIAYRVLPDCSVEAILPAGLVKFKNIDQFLEAANALDNSRQYMSSDVPEITNRGQAITPASKTLIDYYSILLDAIHETQHNSDQLRALVYERARFNLKREFLFGNTSLSLSEILRRAHDFESAIARIEADAGSTSLEASSKGEMQAPELTHPSSGAAANIVPSKATSALQEDGLSYTELDDFTPEWRRTKAKAYLRTAILLSISALIALAVVGGAGIAAMLWRSVNGPTQVEIANKSPSTDGNALAQEDKKTIENSPRTPYPLPTSFGVYALSNNKLFKLETFPIKVPDPRVALSAEIKKPTGTTISDNNPAFILFRRDLVNNAPDTITLRVVARIMHETKFVGGKPVMTDTESVWRVRNLSYTYKVSPVPGQTEMVIAYPDSRQPLPAGRYALVLSGSVGYDLTVDSSVKSSTHCLEGFEALSGTVYSECRGSLSTGGTK